MKAENLKSNRHHWGETTTGGAVSNSLLLKSWPSLGLPFCLFNIKCWGRICFWTRLHASLVSGLLLDSSVTASRARASFKHSLQVPRRCHRIYVGFANRGVCGR